MKIHSLKRCLLPKLNSFDQSFMKLGYIVTYYNVFFKFDNGPCRAMLSGVIALCSRKFTLFDGVWSQYFDHNFMKIVHNVYYHDVFLEFDNGLYGLRPS